MYNDIITLISQTKSVDEYGDTVMTETLKQVFCEVKSIGQSEFYQAQANGLKPEIKFVIADFLDYSNEEKLKYQPYGGIEEVYSVIRTYRNGNSLEITCNREVVD